MGAHMSSNAAAVLVIYLFLIVGVHGEEPQVPALFIFGDSITNNGNNNYITTLAKGNFFPYCIDFEEGRATGRFCNGMTTVDVLAKLLGLPLIPPYADASTKGVAVMNGVNYASRATGILDETRRNLKLYNLEAHKFAVEAVGPLGCLPSQLANNINGNSTCVDRVNQEVSLFNSKLKPLLRIMEINLPRAHFVYGDAYSSVTDIINNPTSYGIVIPNSTYTSNGSTINEKQDVLAVTVTYHGCFT
ncbi:GDSL esterase/lipase 7-like [Cryptomeria japonica]|uniref:GDSL esterase/lipase 7-like n=1 Tax=Cryptomeria japonica TaxID=3369 RepID=UPI0027D9EC06|nr:GDSL esterase/lipase 7-like [Cryptomeria japonica]